MSGQWGRLGRSEHLRFDERWTGEPRLRFDLEGHGREEIAPDLDLSRTVGWFTTIFPVTLAAPPGAGPGDLLRGVKEALRAVPRRGLGYGLLRYLEEAPELAAIPASEVAFNYLGQLDAALGGPGGWELAPESTGPGQSPRRGAEDPSHARPERRLAHALQEPELHQHAVHPTAREDQGRVPPQGHVLGVARGPAAVKAATADVGSP